MDFEHPAPDPVESCRAWLSDSESTGLPNPNAMTLATVDPDGRPSCRVVLIKAFDERGAVFYTNRQSRKGRALQTHPSAMLGFHWDAFGRQLLIEGSVTLVADAESDAYFASRPRASQIGAWASHQSEPVADRATLDAHFAKSEAKFEGGPVPRPDYWGGYRVSLDVVTFWQSRPARLHDRIRYTSRADGWLIERLFP